jgi:hypothetical protein
MKLKMRSNSQTWHVHTTPQSILYNVIEALMCLEKHSGLIDGYGSIKKLQGLRSTKFGFKEALER